MRLIADGTTAASRLVLVNELESDGGYAFELDSPLFLAVGDRVGFEGGHLVVARASGERLRAVGFWSTRCRIGRYAPPPPLDPDGERT
ncbi:hypothetical protein GCM10009639_54970 [Kitasatospora putterlickiae]|uniref:Uncharacterized protein n=1 Tax=Kitasatospora putterlickiae TaxID=221725 RepID=A0ABP4J668_9ACTN